MKIPKKVTIEMLVGLYRLAINEFKESLHGIKSTRSPKYKKVYKKFVEEQDFIRKCEKVYLRQNKTS